MSALERGAAGAGLSSEPATADVAVLRLNAPFEHRPGSFESFFHAGSLEFGSQERERLLAICRQVPTVVVLFLDRPAVVPELPVPPPPSWSSSVPLTRPSSTFC